VTFFYGLSPKRAVEKINRRFFGVKSIKQCGSTFSEASSVSDAFEIGEMASYKKPG